VRVNVIYRYGDKRRKIKRLYEGKSI